MQATNEHGVHSPFVYAYLTKCLYQKTRYSKNPVNDIILKTIGYFQYSNGLIHGNGVLNDEIRKNFPDFDLKSALSDIVYFENIPTLSIEFLLEKYPIPNHGALVFNGIYKSREANNYWQELIGSEKFTVSIDCYYCGILFIRKEQVKEHFRIRI